VPVNFAHWYFAVPPDAAHPLPGDEIIESDGTVWTILEVNYSPLACVWQTVCETFVFAEPTECVDHLRQDVTLTSSLPVRIGTLSSTESAKQLPFYIRDAVVVEPNDVFLRSDGTLWRIVRVERSANRARWTAAFGVQS
jgi:hypothetical protein